jgi:rSAM/selenodomain-associated transferase 1
VAADLIILFAKAPIAGQVKTRLLPALSPQAAADLHTAFVYDMICRFSNLSGFDFELHTDIRTDAWSDTGVTRKLQISGHLGLKMIHALTEGTRAGYERSLISGSDAPTLPVSSIQALFSSDADVALGPADDGGFYAISARRTDPFMFAGVAWSQPHTMAESIKAMEHCGLTVEIGPAWFDIDNPADLDRLRSQPDLPPYTAAALCRITAMRQGTG